MTSLDTDPFLTATPEDVAEDLRQAFKGARVPGTSTLGHPGSLVTCFASEATETAMSRVLPVLEAKDAELARKGAEIARLREQNRVMAGEIDRLRGRNGVVASRLEQLAAGYLELASNGLHLDQHASASGLCRQFASEARGVIAALEARTVPAETSTEGVTE